MGGVFTDFGEVGGVEDGEDCLVVVKAADEIHDDDGLEVVVLVIAMPVKPLHEGFCRTAQALRHYGLQRVIDVVK